MNFNKLSIEEKFGQMLMIGLDVYDINDEIIELIQKYKIGGIILYKKNYTSIEKMTEFINKLKEINKDNVPMFIAIDQENGRVNRLPKEINRMYNARKLAKCENEELATSINEITAYILRSVGVNMNFAPVLDIDKNIGNRAIGDRSYGDNVEIVNKYGIKLMKSLQKNNIVSVVKHFPGHGATNKDSHFTIPYIKDTEKLEKEDMKTFEYAIENECDAIMVGHLRLKGYGRKPASFNTKIINDLLIEKYKYNNLIVTDDLRMGLLSLRYGLKKLIKNSINAHDNIIMIKYKKGDIKRVYKKLYKQVKNYELNTEAIENSAKIIMNIKKKYHVNNDIISNKLNIEEINNKIDKINNLIDKEVL